jgi:hypothetical protein
MPVSPHELLGVGDLLERTQWDFFWIPPTAEVVDRPELLYVRSPTDSPLLNCVTRTRARPDRLPAIVEEVSEAHRGVCSRWLVRDRPESRPLEQELERAVYAPSHLTLEYAVPVDRYLPRPAPALSVRSVESLEELRDCCDVIDAAFPGRPPLSDEQLAFDLERCTGPGRRVRRFVAYETTSGRPVSSGGMTLFRDLAFGLLWAGGTIPEARSRGAYSAVLGARVREAAALGLRHVGLYAISDTSAPVVARQGFERHGAMTYWERPACAARPKLHML